MNMPNKLLALPEDSPLVRKLDPHVESSANPPIDWLMQARAEMNRDEALKDFFRQAQSRVDGRDWAVDNVSVRLAARWDGRFDEARACVQYLWDEFYQLGDGIHLVSTATGKVIATLDSGDIWQPPPVPREDGSLATPLPRMRPDLEGLITAWASDQERERRIVSVLVGRAGQTALVREMGDPRLLPATVAGRKQILTDLAAYDPETLLRMAGGTAGTFLKHFDLVREDPTDTTGLTLIEGEARTRSVMGVQDQTTLNLRYDQASRIRGTAVQAWVREMGRLVAAYAHQKAPPSHTPATQLGPTHLRGATTWVSTPSVMKFLHKADRSVAVLPVEGAEPTGLIGKVGSIVVPEEFETGSLERFDRWHALTGLTLRMWVNFDAVVALGVSGVPHQAVVL